MTTSSNICVYIILCNLIINCNNFSIRSKRKDFIITVNDGYIDSSSMEV